MSERISIEERPPEDGEDVIIYLENGRVGVGCLMQCEGYIRFKFNGTSMSLEMWEVKPTHWSPLPK